MGCYDVGPEIIVASLIYIDRLLDKNKNLILTETNAKCILHSALTLASKFFLDKYEKKTIFYAVCGLSKNHMRAMLDMFLDLIEFQLYIDESEYSEYMSKLKKAIASKFR